MTGPHIGSRPWALLRMQPGDSLCLEAPAGRATAFQQQVYADIHRNGLAGSRRLELLLAIHPSTRRVFEIVRATVI
jgi:hypothetical protein